MKTLAKMDKDERSLLLYLETCLVDNRGRVDQKKLNNDDRHIMELWRDNGFVNFGRIHPDEYMEKMGTHWVELSEDAWKLAHEERRARSRRLLEKRAWLKSEEV